jgi:hypothetical protein
VKRILILAVVLLSSVALALPVAAGSIDTYINGPWLKYFFQGPGADASGCAYCGGDSAGENQVFLDPAPWTLDLAGPAVLKITDAFLKGDNFSVYDFKILKLTTPSVDLLRYYGSDCGSSPENCYGAEGVSYGTFDLAVGLHSLTIRVADSPYGQGAAYFRIDRIIGTPEPGSMLLVALGIIGIGVLRRRH